MAKQLAIGPRWRPAGKLEKQTPVRATDLARSRIVAKSLSHCWPLYRALSWPSSGWLSALSAVWFFGFFGKHIMAPIRELEEIRPKIELRKNFTFFFCYDLDFLRNSQPPTIGGYPWAQAVPFLGHVCWPIC